MLILRKCNWIDYSHAICCIWIVAFHHMDRYLEIPRGLNGQLDEYVTSGVLATFYFISGYLAWRGYYSTSLGRKIYASVYIKKRIFRLVPLFFISVTSLFGASFFVDSFSMTSKQYLTTLIGVSWLFPAMIPTLWFCSILLFYIMLTTCFFVIEDDKIRGIAVVAVYIGLLVLSFAREIDNRVLLYYPIYFINYIYIYIIKMNRNRQSFFVPFYAASLLVMLFGYIVYNMQVYLELMLPIRMFLDGIFVVFVVHVCHLINGISGFVDKAIQVCANASLCVYLFHRQFFEAIMIVMGKFERESSWLFLIVLFFCSVYIQHIADIMINKSRRGAKLWNGL